MELGRAVVYIDGVRGPTALQHDRISRNTQGKEICAPTGTQGAALDPHHVVRRHADSASQRLETTEEGVTWQRNVEDTTIYHIGKKERCRLPVMHPAQPSKQNCPRG